MKRRPISRTLELKPIEFAKKIEKSLSDLILEIDKTCDTVGKRMIHDTFAIEDTTITEQVYFYNNLEEYENGAVYLELWSYSPGRMPAGFIPNINDKNAKYDIAQIKDDNGNPKEIIHISHILTYKGAAIIEAAKGTGGAYLIQKYLNKITRENCKPKPPSMALTTAISSDLRNEINQGGGAVSVSLGLSEASEGTDNKVSGMLSSALSVFNKTKLVTLNWRANDNETLDPEEVVAEALAAKDDHLDKIHIKLKHGSIKGLSKFRITSSISVSDIGGKNPDHTEIKNAMINYLKRLMTKDKHGKSTLDHEGRLNKNV